MLSIVFRYGIVGGCIVALPMVVLMVGFGPKTFESGGYVYGYVSMLVALTTVFLGIKHYRDRVQGGVIKFGTALLVGLAISAVASLIYALGWELSLAWTGFDFGATYAKSMIEAARVNGASEAELQKVIAEGESFAKMYANPVFRIPMSFIEMFPVGVLISLLSAGLLRNSRLLPARA